MYIIWLKQQYLALFHPNTASTLGYFQCISVISAKSSLILAEIITFPQNAPISPAFSLPVLRYITFFLAFLFSSFLAGFPSYFPGFLPCWLSVLLSRFPSLLAFRLTFPVFFLPYILTYLLPSLLPCFLSYVRTSQQQQR